ncbi:MAG: hypothetical protein K2X53_01525 [Alphaproteobacteria bacterium]|nr:hypothetical protein [Alphaproteobacteria bacterium]
MNYFVFILSVFISIFNLSLAPVYSSMLSDEVDFCKDSSGDSSWSPYSSSNDLLDSDESLSDSKEQEAASVFKDLGGDENDSLNSGTPYNHRHPRYQVRTQIKNDLDLLTNISQAVQDKLADPLLCLGTGRLVSRLFYSHLCPTLIEADDYCVDIRTSLKPDESFNVFDNESLFQFHKKGMKFGFIYFSHLGAYFPHDNVCCYHYSKILKPGGSFLFKSFAFFPEVDIPTEMSFKDMGEVSDFYTRMFRNWGFENIQVIEKPEAADLIGEDAYGKSLIIYAEKEKDVASVSLGVDKLDIEGVQDKSCSLPQSPDIGEENDLDKTLPIDDESDKDSFCKDVGDEENESDNEKT